MGDDMPVFYIATDENGNIVSGSTTHPDAIPKGEGEQIPNYEYEFDLTWEQIDNLWKYKIVNGELVLK
jgi:hypothetical protein